MITVTDEAVEHIKDIAEKEEIPALIIRMKVLGGGCSGFQHDLYFEDEESIGPLDEEMEFKGIRIIVDPISFQYIDGTELGWVEESFAAGFKFNNPNVSASCACGSSVAF